MRARVCARFLKFITNGCQPLPPGHGLRNYIAENIAGARTKIMFVGDIGDVEFDIEGRIAPKQSHIKYQAARQFHQANATGAGAG